MLKGFFRKHGWNYIPGAILLILSTWLHTRSPIALGNAIELFAGSDYAAFAREAWRILWIALGVFVTRLSWRYFIIGTSREMEIYLRDKLFSHLEYLPIRFYGENRSGDLMAYAVNDVGAVRMTFGMVMAQSLSALTNIGFSVGEMAAGVHPSLTLFALLPVPVAIFFIIYIGRSVQTKFKTVQESFSNISGHVQENINGMRVLKAFAMEKQQYESYQAESDGMRKANLRLSYTSAMLSPVIQVLFGLCYAVGLVYGGRLVIEGEIGLGDYVAFNSYLTMIVQPVMSIGRIVNMLQRGLASYKRMAALMKEEETPVFDRTDDGRTIEGTIEAKNLSFTYPDGDREALKDVSFSIPKGGTLGIAGKTGSGKSTLFLLLTKLLPAQEGQLFIDGQDITSVPAASLRRAIGYVPQDGFLFNTTIEDNIAFFTGATHAEVECAACEAGLEKDLAIMPDGFNTVAGERGNHLSGGQRQRVALARAFVRNPSILLLDDTLSAVDTRTENRILENLRGELEGRTAVIISHRLSALKEADEILFMENGRVAERGTHEALLALGGRYAAMWTQQTEAEDEE
ncbi:MAG: ABC transporter ATP-binding protein [Clostridiales bacterium]|nr:ABC transporter ATP-binding protein [Clostridiales bacterium]